MSAFARAVKFLSARTRSTSAASESTINAFTLVPFTRATASHDHCSLDREACGHPGVAVCSNDVAAGVWSCDLDDSHAAVVASGIGSPCSRKLSR